ncbi:hypothetical protein [Cytophaga sp. FL35]|uniref:hypothetical protein n=1 Tax=Cytophaga sp. FL35 TaxID=1904456 RepID=UPI001653CB9E|nr:hypothetical protein [Cytophaga sp. FL35]MBC6998750.1 hypothetical protein [Cytophaga sp. FL35]
MKTYRLYHILWVLLFVACSKSEDTSENSTELQHSGKSSYTMLLDTGEAISSIDLEANGELLYVHAESLKVSTTSKPEIEFFGDNKWSTYTASGDCKGELQIFDFQGNTPVQLNPLKDLNDCKISVHAMLHTNSKVYLGYEYRETPKKTYYFIRSIGYNNNSSEYLDIPLDKKPVGLALANQRLFVLTLDLEQTSKNALTILDSTTDLPVHSTELDSNARKIFKGPQDQIIVSYDDHHTAINSQTLAESLTKYGTGTEPNFNSATSMNFDTSGKMYYDMPGGPHSSYPTISAVYDFDKNSAVLYAYENFMTEEERQFEYQIENTTVVSYDSTNDLILIGYKKSIQGHKGGLIRIKPAPQPKFVDNTDTDGIPYAIFVN